MGKSKQGSNYTASGTPAGYGLGGKALGRFLFFSTVPVLESRCEYAVL
jgi:hypothetical protein